MHCPKNQLDFIIERIFSCCRERKKRNRSETMMDDTTKTINLLIETERLADKILQNKQETVALDKRRQDTREAIRELGKSVEKKAWITVGSMLIEMKKEKALELLQSGEKFRLSF